MPRLATAGCWLLLCCWLARNKQQASDKNSQEGAMLLWRAIYYATVLCCSISIIYIYICISHKYTLSNHSWLRCLVHYTLYTIIATLYTIILRTYYMYAVLYPCLYTTMIHHMWAPCLLLVASAVMMIVHIVQHTTLPNTKHQTPSKSCLRESKFVSSCMYCYCILVVTISLIRTKKQREIWIHVGIRMWMADALPAYLPIRYDAYHHIYIPSRK